MFDLGSFSPLDASLNRSRLEDFQMINVPIIRSKAKKSKNIAATVSWGNCQVKITFTNHIDKNQEKKLRKSNPNNCTDDDSRNITHYEFKERNKGDFLFP